MKKVIASVSFLFYLAASTGVVMNFHYCMDRLASVHLFETSVDVCGRCGMDTHESNGCCRDEVKVEKIQQDQNKIPVALYELPVLDAVSVTPSAFITASFQNAAGERHFHNHSPPLLSAQDTYLQINVFRI